MRKIADRIWTWASAQLSIANALLTGGLPDSEISLPSNLFSSASHEWFSFYLFFLSPAIVAFRTTTELLGNSARLGGPARKGRKMGEGGWARRGRVSRCNFPAERYVLRMYDGFRAWNFRRSPFAHENRHNVRNTRAMHPMLVGLQLHYRRRA